MRTPMQYNYTRIMPAGHWGREAIKSDSRTRQHPKLIYLRMKLKEHWRTLSHLHWFGACETLCLSQTWSPNLIDAMEFGRHSGTQNESMGTRASLLCNMRWIGRYNMPELSRWSYTVKSTTNYQPTTNQLTQNKRISILRFPELLDESAASRRKLC